MKRSFTLFTALLTLLAMLSFTAFADDGEIVVGDVDGDGEVTFEDYIIARLLASADTNSDGVIDESDYTAILDYITSGISMPEHEHSIVIDAAVEPTCLEPGFTAGAHCSACGKVIIAQQKIPSKDHTVVIVDGVKPTCTSDGVSSWAYCSDCGKVLVSQETLPASGHAYGTPTYTWNNKECTASVICANDEDHKITETVKGVYVKDTDATYTADERGHYEAVFADSHFTKQSTARNSVVKYGTMLEDPDHDPDAPGTYLWLKADDGFAPSITFTIPGDKFTDADYRIIAHACFEGCEGEGTAYVNYYVYSKDATGIGNFEYLIQFADFANHKDAGEGWKDLEFTFNPCTGLYGSYDGTTVDPSEIGFVTVGIGFWQTTGTIKCSEIRLIKGVEVVWSKDFGGKFDPENDEQTIHSALGTKGTNWGIVKPEIVDNGNIAKGADIDAPIGGGIYTASLNDGAAFSQEAYDNNWYGFNRNQNVETGVDYKGAVLNRGTVIYDFGKTVDFYAVRAHIWDCAGSYGIASPTAIVVSASDDGEEWNELGSLTLGEPYSIYWAELYLAEDVSARFVKVEFYYEGAWLFLNEIEVLSSEYIDDPEEPGNHTYSEPVYNWNNDTCTALRVCLDDSSLSVIETVTGVYVKDTNATYTADETGHYEASFKSPLFTKQSTAKGSVVKYGTMFEEAAHSEGLCYTSNGDGTCSVSKGDCTDTEIVIPPVSPAGDIVTTISDEAFYDRDEITSVIIPDSVTYIGDWAFEGCSGLTSLVIPDSVTEIGSRAFEGCYSLTSIVIPDSVTEIGDWAFFGCSSLTSIVIPDSVTKIGEGAFDSCHSLTSIVIPDSVTEIGGEAFYGCSGLTSVIIPDSVTYIGYGAFWNCGSLTSIAIPDSVTYIDSYAFCGCTNLEDVYYSGTSTQWRNITIDDGNGNLKNAEIHFNS